MPALFILMFIPSQEKVSEWVLVNKTNEITVSTRTNSLSDIKEVKVTTEVDASLSTLVNLIKDVEGQPKWAYKVIEAKEVKTFSDFHWIAYSVTELPWPLSNRDNVTDCKLTQYSDSSILIYTKSVDGYVEESSDNVRIPYIRVIWKFTPLKSGKVKVKFQMLLKIGGSVPEWVANMFVDEGPYQTIVKLREMVLIDEYKDVKLHYIKE